MSSRALDRVDLTDPASFPEGPLAGRAQQGRSNQFIHSLTGLPVTI